MVGLTRVGLRPLLKRIERVVCGVCFWRGCKKLLALNNMVGI